MDLIIDGKKAVLKKGSSFDYVSENRAFSDADDYTLSISLPLAGCPENLAIFGHLERMDVDSRNVMFDAAIICPQFSRYGIITVVEASETEVKCQFLEGRSVQNFRTDFDDIYINELTLGALPTYMPDEVEYALMTIDQGRTFVALPWWNESSEYFNNEIVAKDGELVWAESTVNDGKLSYMPYLIYVAKMICESQGYTYNFTSWEESDDRFLLVCNALPAAWDIEEMARALPHWTITEFFEELEKLLVCEFDIDHKAKHIDLTFCDNEELTKRETELKNVVDTFSCEISRDDELCKFRGIANYRYKARDDNKWKEDQCQWLVDLFKTEGAYYMEFETEEDFQYWYTHNVWLKYDRLSKEETRADILGKLMYVKESDAYFLFKIVRFEFDYDTDDEYYCASLVEVNKFADCINDKDSDNDVELSCVPVRVDETDSEHGHCIFLSPSGFSESGDNDDDGVKQTIVYSSLLKGEPDSAAEYYDTILLAYLDGNSLNDDLKHFANRVLPPCPYTDKRFSLARRYENYLSGRRINPKEKFKVSWLSSKIPNVRAVFFIGGKRYLCEKITATFTEDGMSQLLKGEFYPLLDTDS